jgi:hypothetical protein
MTWAGHVARIEEVRNAYAYSILFGIPEGKRPFRRFVSRCEDNIKIYLEV